MEKGFSIHKTPIYFQFTRTYIIANDHENYNLYNFWDPHKTTLIYTNKNKKIETIKWSNISCVHDITQNKYHFNMLWI